ncbi:hypothetical protein NMY22_g17916 [Coprinellus aureogranulatus]|nr:hypothetical protein NMY22_g17916 [Coprinellus aureogranulatus]
MSLEGSIATKHWQVPSLTFTQPTPESTKSSRFSAHQRSVDKSLESGMVTSSTKEDRRALRQVLEEVDPIAQECSYMDTTSVWLDTVESSVNTNEVEGTSRFLGGIIVNEHGSILHEASVAEVPRLSVERHALSKCVTRTYESPTGEMSKKRWSLMSSLKSKSTTRGRSIGSGTSIWTRLSMALSSTGGKTSVASLACSDDEQPTLACPSLDAGLKECFSAGSISIEKQGGLSELAGRRRSAVYSAHFPDNDDGINSQRRRNKRTQVATRFNIFLRSVKDRVWRYHGALGKRRGESKWEGRSIPPEMA